MKANYKKVVEVMPFLSCKDSDDEHKTKNPQDYILYIAAIPFIGTLWILLYLLCRHKEIYYEKIK